MMVELEKPFLWPEEPDLELYVYFLVVCGFYSSAMAVLLLQFTEISF
jgi:hypothetical protein